MRKVLIIFCLILFTVPLVAQQRTGNIFGRIVDTDGNPLPGVTVTCDHGTIAPISAISSVDGVFRFLSLFPARDYVVKAELEGFKPILNEGIGVEIGTNTEITITMELGTLEEEITVTAVTPVIDTRKTSITNTVGYEALQSLPTSRDPWVILQMTPAIEVDRENVGGSESGQQSGFAAKGGARSTGVWTVDGVNISDPAAIGASPGYYDFDAFEELQITTGGADVENQTGGVSLNMVSRRGGSRLSLGGRFFLTDEKFQSAATGSDVEMVAKAFPGGPGYNRVVDIKDFGFNVGGPIIQDKVWWWGSYGVQEIKTNIIIGTKDNTNLMNLGGKINIQLIPQNRLELFITAGKKEKFGRDSSSSLPQGRNQHGKYHFGSPIMKLQDEHMFGDSMFVSLRLGFTDAGFGNDPANDMPREKARWYDVDNDLHEYSYSWYMYDRPNKQAVLQANYFNDNLFGASHELKVGVEIVDRRQGYVGGSPGNIRFRYNYASKQLDWDGDGKRDVNRDVTRLDVYRSSAVMEITKAFIAYLSDTITFGRFTLKAGVRFDRQTPIFDGATVHSVYTSGDSMEQPGLANYGKVWADNFESGVAEKMKALIPWMDLAKVDPGFNWDIFTPRFGLTWDVTGNGKTLVKLNAARYGDFMGTWADMWGPGGTSATLRFWWDDLNGNGVVGLDELYWANYDSSRTAYNAFDANGNFVGNTKARNLMYASYDVFDPNVLRDPTNTIDPNWSPPRTSELLLTVERELFPDFALAVDFTYRKYDNFTMDTDYWPDTGIINNRSLYVAAGTVPQESFTFTNSMGETVTVDTGEAAGKTYYLRKAGVKSTSWDYVSNYGSDRYYSYYGMDIRFNKRLSNRWMLNGSFSLQKQTRHYGETLFNPTNLWTLEGNVYAPSMGSSSGKINQYIYSNWMFKIQGLYQLPYDFNASFTFNARPGHINAQTIDINDPEWENSQNTAVNIYTEEFGSTRLPNFWNLSLRVEKVLRMGDTGKIYLMIDGFNILNNNVMNRRQNRFIGDYYMDDGYFSRNKTYFEPNEVLNPRTIRFGVRFQF